MYKLEEFKQLVKDFAGVADFLVVYVAEAHSTGEGGRSRVALLGRFIP